MKNRYLVLGLSIVLALAMAVPALGGPSNPIASISATVQQTAKQALNKAKAAQKKANAAQGAANAASSAASKAQTTANGAAGAAAKAQTTADTALSTANAAAAAAKAAQDTANSKVSKGTNFEEGEEVTASSEKAFAIVGCPKGEVPSGGGFVLDGTESDKARVDLSSQYLSAWVVEAENVAGQAGSNWELTSIAICMG